MGDSGVSRDPSDVLLCYCCAIPMYWVPQLGQRKRRDTPQSCLCVECKPMVGGSDTRRLVLSRVGVEDKHRRPLCEERNCVPPLVRLAECAE